MNALLTSTAMVYREVFTLKSRESHSHKFMRSLPTCVRGVDEKEIAIAGSNNLVTMHLLKLQIFNKTRFVLQAKKCIATSIAYLIFV